ncbi:MAG: hypothetical protein Q8R87_01895 [Anaerolineaceae bacterium]|nr:hypothetical protein [Anaerolineaceae bacterium]
MKRKLIKLVAFSLMVFLLGCSKLQAEAPTLVPTDKPVAASIEETAVPTSTSAPVEEVAAQLPTEEPTAVVTEIIHETIPENSKYSTTERIDDCSTGERVALGATTLIGFGCDNWEKAKLERPADKPNGTYYPVIDIVRAEMGTNQVWMFAKINLYEDAAGQLPPELSLGFEIDTDLDSRGNYLILAKGLNSTEWTTDGVQVWWDQTKDVGGAKPHVPDGTVGDGYETLLFDAGQGLDADLAWARINPENGASVEFAFKPDLLPENKVFVWWAWATLKEVSPVDMELVDSQKDTETWMFDNTCSKIFNGKPSKMIVNICEFVLPTPTPTPTSTPAPNAPNAGPVCPPDYSWGWYSPAKKWMCIPDHIN